jgi:hypothetical protein
MEPILQQRRYRLALGLDSQQHVKLESRKHDPRTMPPRRRVHCARCPYSLAISIGGGETDRLPSCISPHDPQPRPLQRARLLPVHVLDRRFLISKILLFPSPKPHQADFLKSRPEERGGGTRGSLSHPLV